MTGKVLYHVVVAMVTVKEAVRLNWKKRPPKSSPGTGRWTR